MALYHFRTYVRYILYNASMVLFVLTKFGTGPTPGSGALLSNAFRCSFLYYQPERVNEILYIR